MALYQTSSVICLSRCNDYFRISATTSLIPELHTIHTDLNWNVLIQLPSPYKLLRRISFNKSPRENCNTLLKHVKGSRQLPSKNSYEEWAYHNVKGSRKLHNTTRTVAF